MAVARNLIDRRYLYLAASRNGIVTNTYLQGPGSVFTNSSPFILPFNCTLIALAASCNVAGTWTAEVHKLNALVAGATLALVAANSNSRNDLAIDFNLGDGIQLFMNGTTIDRPHIQAVLRRR
jgi:hypothetical protein